MKTTAERCRAAYDCHHSGYNCAQSVACAFADRLELAPGQIMAAAGGFGGGVGGSREELCGAVSGGVLALSMLFPHSSGEDIEARKRIYDLAKEFRARFAEVFGDTRCGSLLAARPGPGEKTEEANRMGVTAHCDLMIVTAVELAEAIVREREEGAR